MITKSPIITNSEELAKAEALGLTNVQEQYDYVELGFRLADIMYYKIVGEEIELTFRNGKEEVIKYSNSAATKLKQIFEKV